jgi:aspartate aminotransferase
MYLSSLLQQFSEPETLRMAKLGRELRAQGHDITDLSLGEPDFNTPEHIKQAAIQAVEENYSHYPPVAGYLDLRQAICDKLKRDNNLDYKCENVMVSNGAKQCIANMVLAIVDKGEEVIIPTPYWVSYSEIVRLGGGKPVFIKGKAETGYKITPQQLEEAITERTRLFMFSSPCNPTGAVYTKDELAGLAEVFRRYPDIYIMSDEIYEYINYNGKHESIAQFDDLKDRIILINGLSKGFAMTGYRLGYMAAHADIIKGCDKLQGQFTSGPNAVTQRAAITALNGSLVPTEEMVQAFTQRRQRILELLKQIPDISCTEPDGAFYVFPSLEKYFGKSNGETTVANADDLCMYLLTEAHVSTVTGRAFGEDTSIRISFANSIEKIEQGVQKMKAALEMLK